MNIRMLSSLSFVLALGRIAAGLNLTYMGNCTDSRFHLEQDFGGLAYFNTTGTTNFTVPLYTGNNDTWYLYLTLEDHSHEGRASFIHRWLGVPGSFLDSDMANKTSVCMTTSAGYNKTLENTYGQDTCKGILSDQCVEDYTKNAPMASHQNCLPTDPQVDKACRIGSATGTETLSKEHICFLGNLPGVNVPKGYGVMPLLGISYDVPDGKQSSTDGYDRVVQQSVASFFTFVNTERVTIGDDPETGQRPVVTVPVCAVPDVVQRDSRPIPENLAGQMKPSALILALASTVGILGAALI